MKRIVGDLSY